MRACYALVTAVLLPITALQAAERQVLPGHVPLAVKSAKVLGQVPRSRQFNLAIGLPLRNQEKLELLLQELYDPASPRYHQYLQPEQFAAEFGPTDHDYQTLVQFAESNGLVVTGRHSNRMILDVSGAVSDIERAFHLKILSYWHPARGVFYAPDREPSLDLDVQALDISGLDNFAVPRPMGLKTSPLSAPAPFVTGSGPGGLFIGGDFRAAYAPQVTLDGSGQMVGLLEFDGFYTNDVRANFAQAGLPAVPVQTVLLDGVSGAAGGENIEVTLDIMMAAYMAPGLSKLLVYEGNNGNDMLNRMATDDLAQQLSSSWGFGINSTTEQIFRQYIAQGQSLLQASGDSGAYEGGVMPPSDDPNLTVVGGTSLTTAGSDGPWQSEAAWPGSGGGISASYAIPTYQQGTNMTVNGGSTTMRNIPDVALTADIQMFLICNNGQGVSVGGTSAAAPLWAGFVALANQQAVAGGKSPAGFLNPHLYSIGNGSSYSADFHDITLGNNGGFSAMSGYDLATGWGSPAGQPLIDDLSGTSATPGFTLSASTLSLSVSPGTSGSAILTVGPQNGFNGSVSLAASGLPAGVTASFSPASTSGTSNLTLAVSSSATPGTATVVVTGTSGNLKSTTTIGLTILAGKFGLSASPTSLSLAQGNSGITTLTVGAQNGFGGTVNLTASGLPKGVTASFSPASTTGMSALTLTASNTATAGTATVTVTGVSGSLKSSTTISLTVTAPNFSLTASPTSLSVVQSNSNATTLTITPRNGFNGSVTLAASGVPSGVTASFSPVSNGTSTLTFAAGASVAAGKYTVTVTGTSGFLKNTAAITLTIIVPNFSLAVSPASLSVVQGNNNASTVTITPQNGFNGSVSLTASGVPSGVTAAFSALSNTGTSTLTFTAGASVVAGKYTVTVKGTSGSLVHTAAITLTVIVPNFSLTASPSSLTVIQGNGGVSTVTITPQNGFSGSVSLATSALPSGVTASFGAISDTGTSTLTFAAGASVVAGKYTVTVTGTAGSLVHTAPISLTLVVPNFTLSASPGSPSVVQGNTGVSTVTVNSQNGFNSAVSLAVSGLPSGVTASFSPASTAGTSALTFSAGASVVAGKSNITVTGTSGSLTHTATIGLTIIVPDFSLSTSSTNLGVAQGTSSAATVKIAPQNGFSGRVSLAASGLPSGVTASFSPATVTGAGTLTLAADSSAVAGTSTITVTGTSATLSHTVTMAVTVLVPNAGAALVNLASASNISGIVTDGTTFTGGGLDGGLNGVGTAYSTNLLGVQKTIGGTTFYFGPANASDAVTSKTIALPAGQFSTLQMLATAVNGNQPSQTFTVTYSDGTTSTFHQSLSDWFSPQSYTGESKAITMAHRDTSTGAKDNRTFLLYEYSFALNAGKQISSISLPNNRNVVILAISLTGSGS